jgi:anthranilate/para-aminobenzoate synthase component II
MRLLIIDNGTAHLDQLQTVCSAHDVTTVGTKQFAAELAGTDLDGFDAVILSGSYERGAAREQDYFIAETELVMNTNKPVLGIGLGFELICYSFGCQLHELAGRVVGAAQVVPTDEGAKIFQGTDPIQVAGVHRWSVDELPRELVALARSDTGIEAIKHRTKPIYGLQFHPESFKYSSDGKMVFANILDIFQKSK